MRNPIFKHAYKQYPLNSKAVNVRVTDGRTSVPTSDHEKKKLSHKMPKYNSSEMRRNDLMTQELFAATWTSSTHT